MLYPLPTAPQTPPRIVVTGAGIVTALGLGWKANAQGFRAGRTAFRPVSRFDVSRQRVKTAALVDLPQGLSSQHLGPRRLGRLEHAGAMLLLATREAMEQAGWQGAEHVPLVLGTTAGGMELGETYFKRAVDTAGSRSRQPTRAVYYQPQAQARMVAEALGLGGEITIISNACASGANAIGHAWELLRRGRASRALAGGYDAVTQLLFSGFDSLQALSPTLCRPFDAGRDGLALGEGAGLVALETFESARQRGAEILGELIGYGSVIDVHHLTQPQPQGEAAFRSMCLACQSAGVSPAEIDYINAHGTGTPLNDSSEALAIGRWAGERVSSLSVSSTKAGIGHLLGGAGAVEAVVCLMSLREQWLPPENAFEKADPACAFPVVREPRDARVNTVLSNSFGFGGVNATLIFRRWA